MEAVTSQKVTAERLALIVVVVVGLPVIDVMDAVFSPAVHAIRRVRLFIITRYVMVMMMSDNGNEDGQQ